MRGASALFVVAEERKARHLVGKGADQRKRRLVVDIARKVQIKVIFEVAAGNRARLDLRQVQPVQRKALERAVQGARRVRQRKAQADLVRVVGQHGLARDDDEARAVVVGVLDVGGDHSSP